LENALLKVEGCFEQQKFDLIMQRNDIKELDKTFIEVLVSHRKQLNPFCKNTAIRSNYTRLILLQIITENHNQKIDVRQA